MEIAVIVLLSIAVVVLTTMNTSLRELIQTLKNTQADQQDTLDTIKDRIDEIMLNGIEHYDTGKSLSDIETQLEEIKEAILYTKEERIEEKNND
tara:strand:+ start:337 stop:618 length:282 start_codon:yes stop_codon:yes gene_type:complete